ncbi:MAG TPA: toll/interleukin-1 receptor domain-containing protein [Stellaceae bacterium]|nr:toll/interleukin-1 receptor domain-containing protein [Stellaceae bacterium]
MVPFLAANVGPNLSRIFISHSSRNDDWAIALRDWLVREGWSGEDDIFLDLDPERGIAAGQRWVHALEDAATRCEAVLFLVSEAWLTSKWCVDEYQMAHKDNKKLFALLTDDVPIDRLPGGLTAQWQVVSLRGEPAERFLTVHPRTRQQSPVHIAEVALKTLKRGLEKAGIGPETFDLLKDPQGPLGWRAAYRGLEALEPEDAAVFFGRSADILRGLDALRGLSARKPPRLLVILGASGSGKSSFLRAGLWPRLARDDSQWLPLRAIRSGRGGAIEGSEGLLAALEEVHRRFALRVSRADLRQRLAMPERFVELLRELRQAAARRALLSQPPYPLPVLCIDQAEELFASDAGPESEQLLRLARAAIEGDEALLLATIRSDAYGLMQTAEVLAGIDQVPLSLGPVPHGEIARVIREPAEILRKKAGPEAPVFDAAVVERLQAEIAGESDALPLLAFVLQRLMREHSGTAVIGLAELDRTGGVAAAIESEAEAALADAGFGRDRREEQRAALRRLFIPRLARIDREHKAPQRRIARQSDLPADLLKLAHALTERRLLVGKIAAQAAAEGGADAATLEVAHEALLRRWPTLADLLAEDRDALLLLDGVLLAAADWDKADDARKTDFLAHRGSRLADAQALAARGPDWAREIDPALPYLAACSAREAVEREEKEASLVREQQRLVEIATAQARTARLQRRARWGLAAFAAVVLGRRHRQGNHGPARCVFGRIQPGRDAHRHGVRGQDRAPLGCGQREGTLGPARP